MLAMQDTLQHFTGRSLEATQTGQPLRLRGVKNSIGPKLKGVLQRVLHVLHGSR